jgi:chromosome segregation ATPase|tara:strand:- start:173 stop:577 length:405 start_codon:yes stop_codon:yes gene_type:complete
MGMKLSLILGGLLVVSLAGSIFYINYLNDQIATLKGNQIVLETEIQKQNDSIDQYLKQQETQQLQLNQLESEKKAAMEDVNKLRKTFARHDLDELTLAKPGLIQNKINKASARVMTNLEELTNPNQFDEKSNNN